jgi:hypothetical protein
MVCINYKLQIFVDVAWKIAPTNSCVITPYLANFYVTYRFLELISILVKISIPIIRSLFSYKLEIMFVIFLVLIYINVFFTTLIQS